MAKAPADEGTRAEIDRVWHEYKDDGSQAARDQLIVHYSPLVRYVASRIATGLPASVELGDLVSWGIFGLLVAIDQFDRGRDTEFDTYAIPRIRETIIDELPSLALP